MTDTVKSLAGGFIASILVISFSWIIWTWFVFEYAMTVLTTLGYNLYPIQHEFYWLLVGIFLLWGIQSSTRVYHYARRGDKV
ncbi:hypothetical protein LCGC14_2186580 [marine sediment metagenome]|uniref:Uncharacterized protein n=1 Tax=marine sediment metagenome TaxID=412755 RepID=A0A0F9DKT3_9ZZZZ